MTNHLKHIAQSLTTTTVTLVIILATVSNALGQDSVSLLARHNGLMERLTNNQFNRPMVLESTNSNGTLKGDIYTVVAQPFNVISQALQRTNQWCDILMLHLNVKDCRVNDAGADSGITIAVGRKFDQPLTDAYHVDFVYRVAASKPDYMQVLLSAAAGPLGTKNYRVVVEATPLSAQSTFMHMTYAYSYGALAQVAMQSYLATIGRNKIGFSIIDRKSDGAPVYINNIRGVVERNAMRYYLAIEAFLGAVHLPVAAQQEARLGNWFTAIERYPQQLHEMERDDYLSMKRSELARKKAGPVTAN